MKGTTIRKIVSNNSLLQLISNPLIQNVKTVFTEPQQVLLRILFIHKSKC